MLYEENGYIMLSECQRIAFELRVQNDTIKDIINTPELFKNDGEKFWSESCLRRLEKIQSKSKLASESAYKRWGSSERNTNAMPTHSEGNAIKRNKSKVNKKESVKKKPFIPPTISDFISYFLANGFTQQLAERAFRGYDAADWHKSNGQKIFNWKQTCQQVWFKDEHKVIPQQTTAQESIIDKDTFAQKAYRIIANEKDKQKQKQLIHKWYNKLFQVIPTPDLTKEQRVLLTEVQVQDIVFKHFGL